MRTMLGGREVTLWACEGTDVSRIELDLTHEMIEVSDRELNTLGKLMFRAKTLRLQNREVSRLRGLIQQVRSVSRHNAQQAQEFRAAVAAPVHSDVVAAFLLLVWCSW